VNESTTSIAERLHGRCTCSVDEAAELLGIGRSTAYAAARDGSLPVLKVRNRLLVPMAKLRVMLGVEASSGEPRCTTCSSGDCGRDDA
jgi:excisionase family DNA binding protein